jgi:hypothetical protein
MRGNAQNLTLLPTKLHTNQVSHDLTADIRGVAGTNSDLRHHSKHDHYQDHKDEHKHHHPHHSHSNSLTFDERLKARVTQKRAIVSTLQRKSNQFIKELNAQMAEDDGEENSKIVQERVLKKQLMEKAKEKKMRREKKKQAKVEKIKTLTMKKTM